MNIAIIDKKEHNMELKITLPGGKRVKAEWNGFSVETDQPVKDGGEGTSPSPYDYFMASIGTCAGFYVLSFCQKRGIPTENITLFQRLQYAKKPDGKEFLEKIIIEIILPPDFPVKYHDAIIKVADQCAVKKTIMNPPIFEIKTLVQ